MQNIPKIVRERLQAAPLAGNYSSAGHPDPNVLTAFAERSLSEPERAFVLQHLGRCADCRDIVALSLPAMEQPETNVAAPATGRLTWPTLRWGFVAAGVVAIAALGIVQYQRRTENIASKSPAAFSIATKEAKNQPLAPPAPAAESKRADNIQPPPAPSFSSAFDANAIVVEPKRMTRALPAAAPPLQAHVGASNTFVSGSGTLGGPLAHGPRMADQWQQQKTVQDQTSEPAASSPFAKQRAAGDLATNMEVPAVSETVAVEGQSAELNTQAQNRDARQLDSHQVEPSQNVELGQSKDQPAAPPQSNEDSGLDRIGKAKPAEVTRTEISRTDSQTTTGAAPVPTPAAPSAQVGSAALALSASMPRWTINPTGGLQRSFDQGATWQVVDVSANPAYFTAASSVQIASKSSRAKALKVQPLIFRAVAANGPDVWAGGSGGALYHSPDAGDHWTRVMPASSGAMLTGDVVSLEFTDIQHGKVSTSTAEVWTTSDAGQTWQKQ